MSELASGFPAIVADQMRREASHFSGAATTFFAAWKRGVLLSGVRLFGSGTQAGFDGAQTKSALIPNLKLITAAIGPMSSGEKKFLAALVSFYSSHDGAKLLKRAGVKGLADLGVLDLERRKVLAALILNYTGW